MARLVFGMNQSLDGYVDHMSFGPSPALFRHFIEEAEAQAGANIQAARAQELKAVHALLDQNIKILVLAKF